MISKVVDLNVDEHNNNGALNSKGMDVRQGALNSNYKNYNQIIYSIINAYYHNIMHMLHIVSSDVATDSRATVSLVIIIDLLRCFHFMLTWLSLS